MFGFSGEHLLVLLVILLIFGPRRLPDLGHSIGRTLKNFKDGMNGLNDSTNEDKAKTSTGAAPRIETTAQAHQTTPAQEIAAPKAEQPVDKV